MSTPPDALPVTADAGKPRVCVVVIMNHPFPAQLPLLRRIYADRFAALRFLIPFERLPDEDVITVYRGSYTHSGYLTDARRELARVDCDYYLVVHDDVLLNPQLDAACFRALLPLGPDDGFIPDLKPLPRDPGDWSWYFGMLPKLLHPKSQLFGSGIERDTLRRYLPPAERLLAKMRAAGLPAAERARLDAAELGDVARLPTRALLEGLSGALRTDDARHDALDARCLALARELTRILGAHAAIYAPGDTAGGAPELPLSLPLLSAAYGTDLFIVPKSAFESFAHHVGVASAANLFVEIMTPTLLVDACARVRCAAELGLDLAGLAGTYGLETFADPRVLAIHPFKLSRFAGAAAEDALVAQLRAIAEGGRAAIDMLAARYFGDPLALVHPGWHVPERWGVWAAAATAVAPLAMDAPGPVSLDVVAPLAPAAPAMTLSVSHAGGPLLTIALDLDRPAAALRLEAVVPDADGIARIRLATDRLICPQRVAPGNGDARELGIGVTRLARG